MNRVACVLLLTAVLSGGCARRPPPARPTAPTSTVAVVTGTAAPTASAPPATAVTASRGPGADVRPPALATVATTGAPTVVPTAIAPLSFASPPVSPTTLDVSIADYAFRPIAGEAPLIVRWTNLDPVDHDITWRDGASPTLKLGNSFERRFDVPGVFFYRCSIHAGMPGRVTIE